MNEDEQLLLHYENACIILNDGKTQKIFSHNLQDIIGKADEISDVIRYFLKHDEALSEGTWAFIFLFDWKLVKAEFLGDETCNG